MTPDERKVLTELFERVRSASGNVRDAEAEAFIAENVRAQPYAPYLLSQAVIVQEEALKGAAAKIEELERELEQARRQPASGGMFGGLFGGGARPQAAPVPQSAMSAPAPAQQASGPWSHQRGSVPSSRPQAGPFAGQQAQQPQQGGSFLRGALGMAAGVAGGVLLANSLQGMFSGGAGDKHGIAGDGAASGAGAASAAANDSAIAGNAFNQQAAAPAADHIQPASYDEGGWDSGGDDSWDA
jgi:hypothetical protein